MAICVEDAVILLGAMTGVGESDPKTLTDWISKQFKEYDRHK